MTDIGVLPYLDYLADNIDFNVNDPNFSLAKFEEFLAGYKTAAQLESEFKLGSIDNLLTQPGNEWMQDRKMTLSDGTQLFNFKDGDQIILPEDPSIPEGAVAVRGIGLSFVDEITPHYMRYWFIDENGNNLGDVPAYFFDSQNVSVLGSGDVAWSQNSDGSFSPQTEQSVEQSRALTAKAMVI